MFMVIFLFLLLCFIVIAARGCRRTVSARVRRHRRYRKTAQRVLERLPQLPSDGARLSYLRKINPYVFEELLLLDWKSRDWRSSEIVRTAVMVVWMGRSLLTVSAG